MTAPTAKTWPVWMKVLWQGIALFVLAMQVPTTKYVDHDGSVKGAGWLYNLCPPVNEKVTDLYQEWGSARNWLTGLPVYSNQTHTIPIHLGIETSDKVMYIEYNAHPPTMVMLALPFGHLTYSNALIVWHLCSVAGFLLSAWLFIRELRYHITASWLWWILPGLALLSMYDPWRQQFSQGQLNGYLLPLLVGAWIASRRGHASWAGVFIGVAATIKIFPAFLFLFLFLRKQYRGVVAGIVTVVALTALTVLVLGISTYQDYVGTVLPALKEFRCSWVNQSIVGFWHRLLVGSELEAVTPLVRSPALAWGFTILSALAIIGVVIKGVKHADPSVAKDRGYWFFVTAMLLLGPLTWSHSMLLLTIPLFFLVRDVRLSFPPHTAKQWVLTVILALYFFDQRIIMDGLVKRGFLNKPITPLESLLVSSIPFYALLVLFIFQYQSIRLATSKPERHA